MRGQNRTRHFEHDIQMAQLVVIQCAEKPGQLLLERSCAPMEMVESLAWHSGLRLEVVAIFPKAGRMLPFLREFGQSWITTDLATVCNKVVADYVDEAIHGTMEEHLLVREFCAHHTATGPPRHASTATHFRQRIAAATGVDEGVVQNILHELGLIETTLYQGENKMLARGYKTAGGDFLHALDDFWAQNEHRAMFG